MAAQSIESEPQPQKGGYRDHPWYHPKRLTLDALGVVAAAVIGQMVVPGIVPYFQMKMFQYTGFDFEDAQFIAVASHQDLSGDPKQAQVEFNRVFCGYSLPTVKSCLMHRVIDADGEAPANWKLDKSPSKDVLLGARSTSAFVAWISEKSGAGGSAVAPDHGNGTYVGYGIACTKNKPSDEGKPLPVKVLYGNLPKEFASNKPADMDKVRASVAGLMMTTSVSVELRDGQPAACSTKNLPDLKNEPAKDGYRQAKS